jgi:glycosyltransferase involved in cell wall biosynthesis
VAVFPFRDGLSGKNSSFWSTMHHATPTLTTRGPGLPSGLVDGENTMLVPTEDHAAIAERLRWADTHRAGLEAIGRAGRDFVVRSFDWSVIARSMHEVFASAVASHPARTEESR